MNEESQKYIAVIFKEWLPLYDSLTPDVRALLKKMADERSSMLATRFYDFIFRIRISPDTSLMSWLRNV